MRRQIDSFLKATLSFQGQSPDSQPFGFNQGVSFKASQHLENRMLIQQQKVSQAGNRPVLNAIKALKDETCKSGQLIKPGYLDRSFYAVEYKATYPETHRTLGTNPSP